MKNNDSVHSLLTGLILVVVSLFAIWWLNPAHIPNNFSGTLHLLDVVLYLMITYIIWHPIVMEILTWSIVSHIKKTPKRTPQKGLKVAFITTFVPQSESISLLEKNLPAMLRTSYEHDTWVLDEGDDEAVKALCERLGVKHFSRFGKEHYNTAEGKFAKKTKGGNHNAWYDAHGNEYDIVAQIDTDFIPKKSFLQKTLGYFRDPSVAWVGTPQIYGNTESSFIAKGAAEQTFSFYGPIMRGMAGMDTAMLIGANHVIRVRALQEVDHYSAHITEDLLTGMKLHAHGWKSVYVPEALAVGEGPSTWKAYFAQQKRWAYGCMHILFQHSPRLTFRMSARRASYYLLIQQHYFMGVAMLLSIVCLSLYYLFGTVTTDMRLYEFLPLYVGILFLTLAMSISTQKYNVRPKTEKGFMFAAAYLNFAVWPIFLMSFFQLFKRKKLVFKVTPKGKQTLKRTDTPLALFVPHLIIAAISLTGIASSFFTGRNSTLMLFWSSLTFVTMVLAPVLVPVSISFYRTLKASAMRLRKLNIKAVELVD